jgi:Flp pilus assembly protein TadG
MASLIATRRDRLRSQRGAELVEFALVLPVLLVMLAGMLDVGLLVQHYSIVTNAAREGARVAIMPGWLEADVQDRVNQYAVNAGLPDGAVLAEVNNVSVDVGARSVPAVQVSVSYDYNYLLIDSVIQHFVDGGFNPTFTLRAAATMRTEVAAGS